MDFKPETDNERWLWQGLCREQQRRMKAEKKVKLLEGMEHNFAVSLKIIDDAGLADKYDAEVAATGGGED